MDRYLKSIFLFFLLTIFFFEGFGINNGRQVAYYLILLMPFFLFIPQLISSSAKKIIFPLKFTALWSLFIVFSLISSFFSVNLQNSFQNIFLYIAVFLIFIFVYNFKELVKESVLYIIFILSFLFSIFSLFIAYFITQNSLFSIPLDLNGQGYQFIYSVGGHNHLGDFLLLPLTILLFWLLTKRFKLENLLFLLFFIPYFIFSYSRSAYLDLSLIIVIISAYLMIKVKKMKKPFYIFGFALIVFLGVLIFTIPSDNKKPSVFNSLNNIFQRKYELASEKTFLAGRNAYLSEALFSFASKPLFGIGPGNFEYASQKYMNNPLEYAPSSHNLFFDVLVENGLLAEIIFLLLFFQIFHSIKHSLMKENYRDGMYIFIFVAMLLNFQTDYTFQIHSFFLLFFVLAGLIYVEKSSFSSKYLPLLISSVLFLIFNFTLISNLFYSRGDYILAFYSYPINKDVYPTLVSRELSKGNKQLTMKYLNDYAALFNGDSNVLIYIANTYYSISKGKEALIYYEKAFDANNFQDPGLIKNIYLLKLNMEGKDRAIKFADAYFSRLSHVNSNTPYYKIYYGYRLAAFKSCREIYAKSCPYSL